MGGLPRNRSSELVSRPTALKIPPQVPLAHRRGLAGGSAVGRLAHTLPPRRGSKPCGRCDSLTGATAAAAEPSPDQRPGGTATGVTPSAATGAPVEPGRTLQCLQAFSGPASDSADVQGMGTGRCRQTRRQRRPLLGVLAVPYSDESASLIAAMASEPARPPVQNSGAKRTHQRGCRREPFEQRRSPQITAPNQCPPCLGGRQQCGPYPTFNAVHWLALDGHKRSYWQPKSRVATDRFTRYCRRRPSSVREVEIPKAVARRLSMPKTHRPSAAHDVE